MRTSKLESINGKKEQQLPQVDDTWGITNYYYG
jgi:hypothetical protein